MKVFLSLLFFVLLLSAMLFAQQKPTVLQGEVSYITSHNVYVRFENTRDIPIGATLSLTGNDRPCLIVKSKSSTSCVCSPVDSCLVSKGDPVVFVPAVETPREEPKVVAVAPLDTLAEAEESATEPIYQESIRGRISASSYSNIASERADRHRFMARFSLDANHIRNSPLSFNTYLNFRQIVPTGQDDFTPRTTYLNVFNLALRYDMRSNTSIVLGRSINTKISSLGAIDGLQLEQGFGNNYVGVIGGFRPDIMNFGFNPDLLQYGGYLGRATQNKKLRTQTTLGLIEQRNGSAIDRRYTYFQHSSTIGYNLSLFSSAELELFNQLNGVSYGKLRLTNLFVSANYRFGRKLSAMLSYDSRRRIFYHETFQTEIERLLDEDIARQGVRLRINARPTKTINVGLSYSRRFQSDQDNLSDNYNLYVNLGKIPVVGGSFNASYNINNSNYLNSNILSLRHSRNLVNNKLGAEFYYRLATYRYAGSVLTFRQGYYGSSFSYNATAKLLFNVSGEFSHFNGENNFRIYLKAAQRLYSKQK